MYMQCIIGSSLSGSPDIALQLTCSITWAVCMGALVHLIWMLKLSFVATISSIFNLLKSFYILALQAFFKITKYSILVPRLHVYVSLLYLLYYLNKVSNKIEYTVRMIS